MQTGRRQGVWLLTPLAAVGFALAALAAAVAPAQQFLFFGGNDFELTDPQIETVSGATQARLEQIQALVADKQWDEAADALRAIAAEEPGRVVAVDEGMFVGLPTYCQMQLAAMPAKGLAAYRRREDTTAEALYRAGVAERDPQKLERVTREMFCSSWGDDALAALGELALERGDYAAARRAWQAISPQLRDPQGRATWFALYDVDLPQKWAEIQPRWQDRTEPPKWLAYPDTDRDLADVRARLILASIREGDLTRAALELDVFRRLHPAASGRLGGKTGPYAAALEQLIASAGDWQSPPTDADWPTFAGDAPRNRVAQPVGEIDQPLWPEPVPLPPARTVRPGEVRIRTLAGADEIRDVPVRESQQPIMFHPIVVDGRVYVTNGQEIRAIDLATGKPAFTKNGVVYRRESRGDDDMRQFARGLASGVPRYTLTAAGGILYARVGDESTTRLQPDGGRSEERLVGIDLDREGLLTFQVQPDDASWSFDGVPVSDGEHVYIAMRHSDVRPGEYVACFVAATGRRLWRTFLGAADTPAAGRGDEATHNLLTLDGDRIYANTNLGIVAALDAATGELEWLRRYDRVKGKQPLAGPVHFDRSPSPCVVDRGLAFVAPADSPQVFALDADTGTTVWASEKLAGVTQLLGVVDGTLVASGNQLWAIDARSGRVRFVWPESEHAGVRGFGRGTIAGQEIFWPTRDRIFVFDVATGRQTREPIDLGPLAGSGANLIAVGGKLLVVGSEKMMLLGPKPGPKPRAKEPSDAETVAMR
jgi:outer membrane protein assembly factor BamB